MIWLPRTTDNSTYFAQSLRIRGIESRLYLRNEFDYWKVHGIMNTFGLLQSKCFRLQVNFARDLKYS